MIPSSARATVNFRIHSAETAAEVALGRSLSLCAPEHVGHVGMDWVCALGHFGDLAHLRRAAGKPCQCKTSALPKPLLEVSLSLWKLFLDYLDAIIPKSSRLSSCLPGLEQSRSTLRQRFKNSAEV